MKQIYPGKKAWLSGCC